MSHQKRPRKKSAIAAVDLFCGVGGLTYGLRKAGVNVTAGVDVDPACEFPFEANNPSDFHCLDVKGLKPGFLKSLYGNAQITLLAGCAPCQPFSTYSQSGRKEKPNSNWELVDTFGRLVAATRPTLVTMENVPALAQHPVFQDFLDHLKGYQYTWEIVECSAIGIPQTRKRLVLLASRLGDKKLSLNWIPKREKSVRKVIGKLPPLNAGEASPDDPLHVACKLSDLNQQRIRASVPGGTWRDWSPSLRAKCHTKSSGETYPSVYGRMEWDLPAPTITTQCFGYGNGRFGHPEQDRAITLREAAMLQTFPPAYKFVAPGQRVKFSQLGRLIGNAVPVRLGEVIGQTFNRHVSAYA